nr:toll-like receptor 3 [Megalopta genalis]
MTWIRDSLLFSLLMIQFVSSRLISFEKNTDADTDKIPPIDGMSVCSENDVIDISNWNLQSIPPRMIRSEVIKAVNLQNNELRDIPGSIFDGLPNIKCLNLARNYISVDDLMLRNYSSTSLETLILDRQTYRYRDSMERYGHYSYSTSDYNGNMHPIDERYSIDLSFPRLTTLRMAYNDIGIFKTKLPATLRHLHLEGNRITHFVISGDDDLQSLYLDHNTNLEQIEVHSPNIAIASFKGCSMFSYKMLTFFDRDRSALKILDASDNNFDDVSDVLLQRANNLEVLILCGNKITQTPDLHDLPQLRELHLSRNQITSVGDMRLDSLTLLSLRDNNIVEIAETSFLKLRALETLDLSINKLEYLPEGWANGLNQLKMLNLTSNRFASLGNTRLTADFGNLMNLYLEENPLTKITDQEFHSIPATTTVHLFNISTVFRIARHVWDTLYNKTTVEYNNAFAEVPFVEAPSSRLLGTAFTALEHTGVKFPWNYRYSTKSPRRGGRRTEGAESFEGSGTKPSVRIREESIGNDAAFSKPIRAMKIDRRWKLSAAWLLFALRLATGYVEPGNTYIFYNKSNKPPISKPKTPVEPVNGCFDRGEVELRLSRTGLSSIGEGVVKSTKVVELHLDDNGITEVASCAFDLVPNLRLLNLSLNNISTPLLLRIGPHKELRQLIVDHNKRRDEKNSALDEVVHSLPLLEELSLRSDGITRFGVDLNKFAPLLVRLSLSKNKIESVAFLKNAPKTLNIVDLGDNAISTIEKGYLSNTVELVVAGNKIEELCANSCGTSSLSIGGMTHLQTLNASRNLIGNVAGDAFVDSYSLKTLDLSANKIETLDEALWLGLKNLEGLIAARNHLTTVPNVCQLQRLKILDLRGNLIEAVTKDSFCKQAMRLETIDLAENKIKIVDDKPFGFMTALHTLELSGNQIVTIPKNLINQARSLRRLLLKNNFIHCLEKLSTERSHSLQELHLQDNPLFVINVSWINHDLPNLAIYLKDHMCECGNLVAKDEDEDEDEDEPEDTDRF